MITIEPITNEGLLHCGFKWAAYQHGKYDDDSVLAGQPKRTVLNHFKTEGEAMVAYPDAVWVSGSTAVELHLPDTPPEWFDPINAGEEW